MLQVAFCASENAAMQEPVLFRGRLDQSFSLAKKLGYDGVELHIRDASEIDTQALFRQNETTGIKVAAIGTGLAARVDGLSLADKNETGRRQAIERVKGCLDLADHFGCCVILGSLRGNVPFGGEKSEVVTRLRYSMLELGNYIEQKNCSLVLEVINRYENNYFNTVRETSVFLEALDLDCVKMHLDTFHMNIEEADMFEAIRESGSRLGHFHLADNTRWYPGHGRIDFRSVLKSLSQIRYNGWISMECLPKPTELEAAEKGLAYIRTLLEEIDGVKRKEDNNGKI